MKLGQTCFGRGSRLLASVARITAAFQTGTSRGERGVCPSHGLRAAGRQGQANAFQGASCARWSFPILRTQPFGKSLARETEILPELDVRDLPLPRSRIDPRPGNSEPGHHFVQGEQLGELVSWRGVLGSQGLHDSSATSRGIIGAISGMRFASDPAEVSRSRVPASARSWGREAALLGPLARFCVWAGL